MRILTSNDMQEGGHRNICSEFLYRSQNMSSADLTQHLKRKSPHWYEPSLKWYAAQRFVIAPPYVVGSSALLPPGAVRWGVRIAGPCLSCCAPAWLRVLRGQHQTPR